VWGLWHHKSAQILCTVDFQGFLGVKSGHGCNFGSQEPEIVCTVDFQGFLGERLSGDSQRVGLGGCDREALRQQYRQWVRLHLSRSRGTLQRRMGAMGMRCDCDVGAMGCDGAQ
jgi:hypothetical protein